MSASDGNLPVYAKSLITSSSLNFPSNSYANFFFDGVSDFSKIYTEKFRWFQFTSELYTQMGFLVQSIFADRYNHLREL